MPNNTETQNAFVAELQKLMYGHLERRYCTPDAPMPMDKKDGFMWAHSDAKFVKPYFNLSLYECPHCKLVFTCLPTGEDHI